MSCPRFFGTVQTEWVREEGEDRHMRLLSYLAFVDDNGKTWTARPGLIFDGASIPRAFWRVIGSPFTGDYRDAAVIHDQMCKDRTVPSPVVHRVFYQAMRCLGVGRVRAALMYAAVRLFGPRF